MNTYTLFWKTGKAETVKGNDPAQAMTLAGYSQGALGALDFYAYGECVNDYEFSPATRSWVRKKLPLICL